MAPRMTGYIVTAHETFEAGEDRADWIVFTGATALTDALAKKAKWERTYRYVHVRPIGNEVVR